MRLLNVMARWVYFKFASICFLLAVPLCSWKGKSGQRMKREIKMGGKVQIAESR